MVITSGKLSLTELHIGCDAWVDRVECWNTKGINVRGMPRNQCENKMWNWCCKFAPWWETEETWRGSRTSWAEWPAIGRETKGIRTRMRSIQTHFPAVCKNKPKNWNISTGKKNGKRLTANPVALMADFVGIPRLSPWWNVQGQNAYWTVHSKKKQRKQANYFDFRTENEKR